ncbi:MAG: GNAT family N-acetyltransferase [Thermoplasmata archaeon]|nr:GNAT family N-acetyltransferase [Thermoplasmata archaeon]
MMSRIEYRHPTENDLESIAKICNDSRRGLPSQRPVNVNEVRAKTFIDSDYDPEGAWLATVDGEEVGYANGYVDQARLAYGLRDSYVEDLEVMQGHRGNGIEETLLEMALIYLKGRGVSGTQIPYYRMDTWKKRLLETAGFLEVRRYYEMVRNDDREPEKAVFPKDIQIERRLINNCPEELPSRIVDVRNESFVDHFNYAPIPVDKIKNFFEATDTTLSVTFAVDHEKTVGFVVSEDRPPETEGVDKRDGWVAILGVVRSHRRRGLGKNLLLDSVNWLTSKGAERILLMVDAENEKALGMYKFAGFEVESVEILMVKDLP